MIVLRKLIKKLAVKLTRITEKSRWDIATWLMLISGYLLYLAMRKVQTRLFWWLSRSWENNLEFFPVDEKMVDLLWFGLNLDSLTKPPEHLPVEDKRIKFQSLQKYSWGQLSTVWWIFRRLTKWQFYKDNIFTA